jgi:hypothetical protein
MSLHRAVVVGWVLGAVWGVAQKPVALPPTGTVTGHVVCGDTQRPARFAQVALLRKPDPRPTGPPSSEAAPHVMSFLDARSGLDGSYTIGEVPPGEYYVVAKLSGYLLGIEKPEDVAGAARDKEKALEGLRLVHVVAERTAQADLTLQRGGAISGRVVFDDGTPVADTDVVVEPLDSLDPARVRYMPLMRLAGSADRAKTDDQGQYRISGLPKGKYVVRATIQNGGGQRVMGDPRGNVMEFNRHSNTETRLEIYQPMNFHKADAKVYEIRGDETIADVDLRVDLNGLHAVRGRLVAESDRHPINAGYVTLTDVSDKNFQRQAYVDMEGRFAFTSLPGGTYTLMVQSAEDVDPATFRSYDPKTLQAYATSKSQVIVGDEDVALDDLLLAAAKTSARGSY